MPNLCIIPAVVEEAAEELVRIYGNMSERDASRRYIAAIVDLLRPEGPSAAEEWPDLFSARTDARPTKTFPRRDISPSRRFAVLKRDRFTCTYCGAKAPDVELHIDHVIPVCKGGTDGIENLATACAECNLGKGGQ